MSTIKPTTTISTSITTTTTAPTQIPNYQYNNIAASAVAPVSNNYSNQHHMKPILPQPKNNNILSTSPALSNNYLQYHQSTVRELNGSQNSYANTQQNNETMPPPPALMPKKSFYEKNGHSLYGSSPVQVSVQPSNKEAERNIVSEMNQMYKHSPFMQRRCEVAESEYGSSPPIGGIHHQHQQICTGQKESIYNNLGEWNLRLLQTLTLAQCFLLCYNPFIALHFHPKIPPRSNIFG